MKINYKYNYGDSISGHRVTGWAGSIFKRKLLIKKGVQLKSLEFFKSAVCIMDLPITIKKSSADKDFILDGLKGHKIYGESENYTKFRKVKKTGRHTHWQTTLKGHAFCLINIPIRSHR